MRTRASIAALLALAIQSEVQVQDVDGPRLRGDEGDKVKMMPAAQMTPAILASAPRSNETLLREAVTGLSVHPKRISPTWLYDERGSALFDRICSLPEYYLARAELSLIDAYAADMAMTIGAHAALVEFGSGTSMKTRVLLDEMESPLAYVPVDVARAPLIVASRTLAARFPDLSVLPVCADFTRPFALPAEVQHVPRRVVYLAGSTLGNFTSSAATDLLKSMREVAGSNGALLVSIDLAKEPTVHERAYNDAAGVTAQFNRNALNHLNNRTGADFDLRRFIHRALWVESEKRIEMHLVSACKQDVHIADATIHFTTGEPLVTEYCHKFAPGQFGVMAQDAGLAVRADWTDLQWGYSMVLLEPVPEAHGIHPFDVTTDGDGALLAPHAPGMRTLAF